MGTISTETGNECISSFGVLSNLFVGEMDRANTVCMYSATPPSELNEKVFEVIKFVFKKWKHFIINKQF